MITILLSRISETQFLIKVTVNDFWGAVAIGFVANYMGAKALNKLIDISAEDEKTRRRGEEAEEKPGDQPELIFDPDKEKAKAAGL
jgi:hypothetical protein